MSMPLLPRHQIRKLHRWGGIFAALFLSLMALSGILMHHAEALGFNQTRLSYPFAKVVYPELKKYPASQIRGDHATLTQFGSQIFINQQETRTQCENPQYAEAGHLAVIHCRGFLDIYLFDGTFVERLHSGLIGEIGAISACNNNLCIHDGDRWSLMNLNTLLRSDPPPGWAEAEMIREQQSHTDFQPNLAPTEFHLARLLTDLHSGALGGSVGRLLVDLLGVLTIAICLSGAILFIRKS